MKKPKRNVIEYQKMINQKTYNDLFVEIEKLKEKGVKYFALEIATKEKQPYTSILRTGLEIVKAKKTIDSLINQFPYDYLEVKKVYSFKLPKVKKYNNLLIHDGSPTELEDEIKPLIMLIKDKNGKPPRYKSTKELFDSCL